MCDCCAQAGLAHSYSLGAVAGAVKALREAVAPGGDKRVLGKAANTLVWLMFEHPWLRPVLQQLYQLYRPL